MIKVAHILKDMELGGIQTLLLDLLQVYKNKNQEVVFIAISDGEVLEDFKNMGGKFYFIPKKIPFFDPFVIFETRKVLIKEKINIIHAHNATEGIVAYFSTLFLKVKTVLTYHVGFKMNNQQDAFIFRNLANKMDLCISPSQTALNELKQSHVSIEKFKVVYNGVAQQRLLFNKENLAIRKKINISDEEILIGMVGNFYNDTRNQLLVCEAFFKAQLENENIKLVFFGGHANQHLPKAENYLKCKQFCEEKGIAGKVIFYGLEKNMAAIYEALDLVLYASRYDTFGMAVVEAITLGKPIMVNDIPLFKEITQDGKLAKLYPNNDSEALAKEISNFAQHFTKNSVSQKEAKDVYSIEKHSARLNQLYQELITKN